MKDKIVVITGANSGIGKSAAVKFAEEGYTVLMACRSLEKSKIVQQEIIDMTNNNNVYLLEVDISSFESIRRFCINFKNKYQKLDILIHNAAYFNYSEKNYQISSDNIELTFATNTVGPYYLTQSLKGMLKKSEEPIVLNSCSTNIRYFFDQKRKIDFDNLRGEYMCSRPYSVYKMYGDSKMALLMLTFKMAEAFKEDGIRVNAIQIPAVKISKQAKQSLKTGWKVAAILQSSIGILPEEIADIYYHICTSQEFKETTGKLINEKAEIVKSTYYNKGLTQEVKQFFDKAVYPSYADNKENIERVWELCVESTREMGLKRINKFFI